MTDLSDNLTVTGLIATILSVVFAIAAFSISRKREAHRQNLKAAARDAAPPPPGSTHSVVHVTARPALEQAETAVRAPGSQPSMVESPPRPFSNAPLFKKLGAAGVEDPKTVTMEKDQYVWE